MRDTGWSFLLRAAAVGSGFLVTVVLARSLGAGSYGIYAYAYALVTLLAIPAQAGLRVLLLRETARGITLDQPGRVRGVWIWASRFTGLLSIVLALGAGGVLLYVNDGQLGAQALTMAWALLLVPLVALGGLRGAALRGLGKIVAGQLPESVLRPAIFLALLGGLALLAVPLTAPNAMALHVLAAALAFGAGVWLLWKHTPRTVRDALPISEARAWLASALPLALIAGMTTINRTVDVLMIGFFEPSDQVGIYRVAVQVAGLASIGLYSVNMVVAPRFAQLHAIKDIARLQRLVTRSARLVLATSLGVTILFLVFGEPLLELVFGTDFAASFLPLLILLGGQLVNSTAGSVAHLLNMSGYERDIARAVAVAAALNIVLNLFLIPLWGIEGAATTTAVALSISNIWLWWAVRRRLGINSLAFGSSRHKIG